MDFMAVRADGLAFFVDGSDVPIMEKGFFLFSASHCFAFFWDGEMRYGRGKIRFIRFGADFLFD